MAALVASDFQGPRPHWTVVAVDLAPEDAGISLEQEMQQAYAAYAATQSNESSFSATDAVATAETSTISEVTSTELEAKIEPVGDVPVEAAVAAPESWVAEPSDVTDESQAPAAPDLEAASSSNDVAPTLETIAEPALPEITSSVQPEIETATTSQQDEFTEARSKTITPRKRRSPPQSRCRTMKRSKALRFLPPPLKRPRPTVSLTPGKRVGHGSIDGRSVGDWRRSRGSGTPHLSIFLKHLRKMPWR